MERIILIMWTPGVDLHLTGQTSNLKQKLKDLDSGRNFVQNPTILRKTIEGY